MQSTVLYIIFYESVYGDLHSGNILVLQQYEAVIDDLGLCKSETETSVDKVTCGVISYMVPEVLRGDNIHIYCFGMIVNNLFLVVMDICKGHRPPISDSIRDLIYRCVGMEILIVRDWRLREVNEEEFRILMN
ncbi:hypothetical protein Glove_86g154 [Diversispora epigaea]|uniref:Protein kinase domain-containing protein n=1 Tax=Diversispora epigaea TaxID=1348612 RepID=A0A397J6P1_9GLOM|nr:hypothetical protein Glove_86g154 [Diversispora epigaea]